MHLVGADLDFHTLPVGANHGRVEGLIHVGFAQCNIVFKTTRNRLPVGVHYPQDLVALPHRIDHNAEADQIEDLIEGEILTFHLPVDAVEVLGSSGHLGVNSLFSQLFADDRDHLVGIFFPGTLLLGHVPFQLIIDLGAKMLQGKILKLGLDPANAQAVGEWGVYLQGLFGRGDLFFYGKVIQCSHVMCAVGQLDQDNPDILCHG